jgi:ABC-type nickel/cobalt efflux system permease component RcnA
MGFLDSVVSAVNAWQRGLYAMLGAEIRSMNEDPSAIASAVVFALALGAVHALTPGHGKAVVFTYFVGSGSRALSGIWMACKVAASHVLSAALLVALFGSAASMFGRPSGVARWLQITSYAAIVLMGIWFLYRAIADTRGEKIAHVHSHTGFLPFAVGLLPCPLTMLISDLLARERVFVSGRFPCGLSGHRNCCDHLRGRVTRHRRAPGHAWTARPSWAVLSAGHRCSTNSECGYHRCAWHRLSGWHA